MKAKEDWTDTHPDMAEMLIKGSKIVCHPIIYKADLGCSIHPCKTEHYQLLVI